MAITFDYCPPTDTSLVSQGISTVSRFFHHLTKI